MNGCQVGCDENTLLRTDQIGYLMHLTEDIK